MRKQFTLTNWFLGLMIALFAGIMPAMSQNLSEGFEGTTFPPDGWRVINGGGANAWTRYTTGPHVGTACASISWNTTAHNDYLITPQLRPTAGNSTISFWSKNGGSSLVDRFNVKVSTTGNNEADFTITLASNIGPGTTYTQYTYDLSAYIGQDIYFAIQAISADMLRLYVDEFAGPGLTPPQAPGIAGLNSPANALTGVPITATLNWTAPTTGGVPTGYRLYFGTDNPPTNLVNGTDLGMVLTYDPNPDLTYATTYYWQIVPFNVTGPAVNAPIWSFTTSLGVGNLQGFTTNGFGIPVGGVQVVLSNSQGSVATTSAANGAYSFTGVPAANYTLTGNLAGYNSATANVYVAPMTTTYQNLVMTRPTMAVTPNPYNVSVNPNELFDGAINISNNGDGLLTWNASVTYTSPGPNTWMTLAQSTGTVNPYTNINLPVGFNASGLAAGTVKTAQVTFTSTPNVGTVVIPVTMTVSGTALGVPTNLIATLTNPISGNVSLSWQFQSTTGFQYFVVKRNGTQIGTTTTTTFANTLPTYGVYAYTVQAVFADGNSAPAGPATVEWSNPTVVLNPTSLYNEQYPLSNETVTFRISNTGQGTLAYSFPEYTSRELLNSPGFVGTTESTLKEVEVAKGEVDPTAGMGTRNVRGAGGPDAFGYKWIDSDETGGPSYVWNDISTTGTLVTGLGDDNVVGPLPLGFSFPFYENTYTSVNLSANGFLVLGSTSTSLTNQNIPNTTTPNNLIAWCWDDLHGAGANSAVYYRNMGNYWIIQFTNYSTYPVSATNTITAQVHLYSNGNIRIYYNNVAPGFPVNSATVGIENNTGTIATKVVYNSAYIHNNLAVLIQYPQPSFITAVTPAQGQVAPGGYVDVTATFTASEDFPVGTHTTTLEMNTNDLANANVNIPATMVVYNPAHLVGTVTSGVDGSPIEGATVVAGNYTALTNADGEYHMSLDAGTYSVTFSKTGFTSVTVNNVVVTSNQTTTQNAILNEAFLPVTLVHAEVNAADTQTEVTWGAPIPNYEVSYDDGTAENYAAWALPGNMNAVRFTPAGYPATVYGGKIYVGDGSFPNNNTGFLGTTFGAMVKLADGPNGMPGTTVDSISVTVNNYGWVEFTGLNAVVTSGNFYLVMVQGAVSPNVAPVGVDQTVPTSYRSYSRNVVAGGAWGLSPYQDMMIRAFINGQVGADNKSTASAEVKSPLKQRGMISLTPATAQSGAEGEAQYIALQSNESSRDLTGYKVWRLAVANPNAGASSGVATLLNGNVSATNYTDTQFGPLPEGWYAYAVAANYTNGNESPRMYSNIVGHKKHVNVTFNVSLTTGGSPEGVLITMVGQDYPYATYTGTIPASGTYVFENIWKGNYAIAASFAGFDTYAFNANIQSNRTFNIIMAESKFKPTNLYVDPLTLVATWRAPLAVEIDEDFEGAVFPPAGWSSYTQNTNGWYAGTTGSTDFPIPPHTTFAVANDDEADGDGCCDYLWTPEMDFTTSEAYVLRFQSYFTGAYGQTSFVEISTNAGATWTVIHTMAPATTWQDIEIDLSQFAGPNGLSSAWIAFHTNDNGDWASGWAIDNVKVLYGNDPAMGYGVFLDGTLVANTNNLTYTYTNLNYGQEYLAGVACLYSSGYSELDTYKFRSEYLIPPTNLQGVNPSETDYVRLTWVAPSVNQVAMVQDALPVITPQAAADVAIVSTPQASFNQTSIPLASSRVVLFDNGPLVNSPGTGAGGADESILQTNLGMSTYGSGMQQSAGNSVADDFTVTGTWTVENFEFFGYQTGSTTTSTFTGIFFRIWDGDPRAGGNIIYGDLTTNRLASTTWTNAYRNDDGPGGSTNRPIMKIVASAPGLVLTAGTYWVEWTATGSGSSGPWVPAVTIPGQTSTGNAIQNQSGAWAPLTDVGPQGMPFVINGTGGGQSINNLLGYNIYRDNAKIAYVAKPNLEYFDLNLEPKTYSYHITAVYDLTPYGFAGQTGESMIEGPISVNVIYGYALPFVENFTTGVFETSKWTADQNWRIAGQAGNPAPSAEFTYNPVKTDYSLSLATSYINGFGPDGGYIDGKIYLDFDLKLDDIAATGDEQLKVEVYNGTSWNTVANFKAEGDINWTSKHINISGSAMNKVFKVRFTAYGKNTLNINYWQIDNIHIYRACDAPTELVASIPNPTKKDQILLNWTAPGTPSGPSAWLKWDSGTNGNSVGLTNAGTFMAASRFTPTQLAQYAGTSLTKVRFFPVNSPGATFVLKVWTGANAANLVVSQPVTVTFDQWNEVTLNSPVFVTGATELWFGYAVTHATGQYPGGTDLGPAVAGFGDMISTDGSTWDPMSTFGLNYNWNLQGFVESVDGVTKNMQSISQTPINNSNATLALNPTPNANNPMASVPSKGSRALTGYNVYRQGNLIANTTETSYLDTDNTISVLNSTWCYNVTAVYEDCESEFSNEACETVLSSGNVEANAVNIYPNPSNNVVNIELTDNISRLVVYNYVGQIVFEQVIAKDKNVAIDVRNYDAGAYLVKFITRSGESFTKKIAVTK